MAAELAFGATTNFGPYVVTRTLPVSFINLGGLTFAGGSLYAVDLVGNIHQLNASTGQSLADWSVPSLDGENATGLAWDGNDFLIASYGTSYRQNIRRLTLGTSPSATVSATYALPRLSWPSDLTYADGQLIYPEYLGPIQKLDPATGQLVGSLPSPSDYVYGLTFDGQNFLAGSFFGTIWRISAETGGILDTWLNVANNIYALAYDESSQSLFIGTRNNGIIVAQVPEPGSREIIALGILGLWFSKLSLKRSHDAV